ncbi:MAG TPA: lipopolysaccharide heptosyltransferase I [Thermoanaerobaculia bacterium]|nr:lipopolysaccharide heptosyltransferase I [Thermoanaerobaculia bacterium]
MKRVLILRLSALGDVIHTIPAVVALKQAMPDADFSWVVESPYAELVGIVAGVRAVPVRLKRWSRKPFAFRADMRGAARAIRGCDVSVDFQGLMKSAGIGWLSRAPERYGFAPEAIRERGAVAFTNRRIPVDQSRHVIEWNLQLAEAVAPIRPVDVDWTAFPDDPSGRLARLGDRVVLLPGAGKPHKQWPADRFRDLAARHRDRALVVWGPGERGLAEEIGAEVAPETNLRELAWLLRHASVVVGADTGPLHLAAALGTRVVGLYGPTDPRRNGPYGQLDRVVSDYGGKRSMASIGVDAVARRVAELK